MTVIPKQMNSSEFRMKTDVVALHFPSKENFQKHMQNISDHFKAHFRERNSSQIFMFFPFLIKKKMDRIYL